MARTQTGQRSKPAAAAKPKPTVNIKGGGSVPVKRKKPVTIKPGTKVNGRTVI